MSKDFSVVARRGFQSMSVGSYESLAEASDAIMTMMQQGGSLGFHIGYNVLYKDEPIFWKESFAESPKEVEEELVSFNMLQGMSDEERLNFVKNAMAEGTIVANGIFLGMVEKSCKE